MFGCCHLGCRIDVGPFHMTRKILCEHGYKSYICSPWAENRSGKTLIFEMSIHERKENLFNGWNWKWNQISESLYKADINTSASPRNRPVNKSHYSILQSCPWIFFYFEEHFLSLTKKRRHKRLGVLEAKDRNIRLHKVLFALSIE